MDTHYTPVVELWKKEYSAEIPQYIPYETTRHLQQIAALFSPGLSYYYILNMHNLELDFISPSVADVTGILPEEASIEKLLATAPREEHMMIEKKEAVIKDFFCRFLTPEELPFYKLVYTYRIKTKNGSYQQMLHQASVLSVSEKGKVQHVLSVHSDITHLKVPQNPNVSFISLNGKESYLNMNVELELFDPKLADSSAPRLCRILTCRELEILKLLANGYNAKKIAIMLNLSFNTIRTHRKNMLEKTDCANTTELVAKSLIEGLL